MKSTQVAPSSAPSVASIFDLDGDGDVDCCDCFYCVYLLICKTLKQIDIYFVGFPIISSCATLCAFVALSFQVTGVTRLHADVETLSDIIDADLSMGDIGAFLFVSVIGVIALNACVITSGLLAWCARIDRRNAIYGSGKLQFCGVCTRKRSTAQFRTCYDVLFWCIRCSFGNGFKSFMMLIVTPLLWILMIIELLTSVLGAAITIIFYAIWQSCSSLLRIANPSLNQVATQVNATREDIESVEEQTVLLTSLFTSLDDATGTQGFGNGINTYLSEAEDSTAALEEICVHIKPLSLHTTYIFLAATILVLIETIIIVRNHIFFERHWYEKRLTLRNDMIQDNFESINYSKRDSVTYNRDGEQLEKRVEDYGSSDTLVCAQDTVKPATPGSAVTNIDEAKVETEMDNTSDRPSVAIQMGIPDSNGDVGQQH